MWEIVNMVRREEKRITSIGFVYGADGLNLRLNLLYTFLRERILYLNLFRGSDNRWSCPREYKRRRSCWSDHLLPFPTGAVVVSCVVSVYVS